MVSTTNDSVWLDSSDGPGLIAVAQGLTDWAPASSRTVVIVRDVKLGGSLTPLTEIVNVWVGLVSSPPRAVPPSSVSVTLTVASPLALAPA